MIFRYVLLCTHLCYFVPSYILLFQTFIVVSDWFISSDLGYYHDKWCNICIFLGFLLVFGAAMTIITYFGDMMTSFNVTNEI